MTFESKGSDSLPSQDILLIVPVFPSEQAAQVREELRMLLEKGAVAPVSDTKEAFIQTFFWYPKRMAK